MLGCSKKGRGNTKNICIMKISKQNKNIYTKQNKKVFLFTKQRRFHQVKVTSPFFIKKNDGNINYKIVEEGSIYN